MIAFFGIMLVLAAMPSSSVLIVVARSATSGFLHGLLVALGIVTGDIIFILIAILGLSLLAETMGSMFVLIKYLGATYLIWIGISLVLSRSKAVKSGDIVEESFTASFMSGLLFTLADQKAILFYLGLFPAFIDLASLTLPDIGVIVLIALVAVGGVKVLYAYMAIRVVSLISSTAKQRMNIVAGCLMISIGMLVFSQCLNKSII